MINRLKNLRKFDKQRLDEGLKKIQSRPALMMAFNLCLLAIEKTGQIKTRLKQGLARTGMISLETGGHDLFFALPEPFMNRQISDDFSVLIVGETTIPQCLRYRIMQKVEQLEFAGQRCDWMNWTQYQQVRNQIHFYSVIIFYRVPGYPKVLANIDYANRLGKITIYDVDDLIFDRDILKDYYNKSTGQLSDKERNALLTGAQLYKKAIEKCQFAMTSTQTLKHPLEKIVGAGNVYLLPNALDEKSLAAAQNTNIVKQPNKRTLFYGSGSKTHDDDFAQIAAALEAVLNQYAQVQLVIIGYLTLPPSLGPFSKRITQIPFLSVESYFYLLAHADINLAPLVPGFFADCKSEIKWLEAGILGVPTIATNTKANQHAITDQENGFLVTDGQQWQDALTLLIEDDELRNRIGAKAKQTALSHYSTDSVGKQLIQSLSEMRDKKLVLKQLSPEKDQRKHLVLVNVLYPPQAMGGATVVVQNIVEKISQNYPDVYHVSVLTYDIENPCAYEIKEYEHNGVIVTAISVPSGLGVDRLAYDESIEVFFDQYLQFNQADLIHFHCIQRLTAALVQSALKFKVPYIVTVHDAWWLSDHQFLVDAQGAAVDDLQSNPLVALQTSDNPEQTLSRSRRLKHLINQGEMVLAVSQYQCDFYTKNGVNNVVVNVNGVDAMADLPRDPGPSDKVVIGYTGSICHHKGYYFLKHLIETHEFKNLTIKVIQFDLTQPRAEKWNATQVEFIAKYPAESMNKFYAQIDVLIAPSMWPESFGLVTREAALQGVWVVASDAGGLAEVVEVGVNGFSYSMGNQAELVKILKAIDADVPRYKQRVAIQSRQIDRISSVDAQVSALEKIYQQILSTNPNNS